MYLVQQGTSATPHGWKQGAMLGWAGLVLAVLTRGCGDATKSTGVSACYYRNIVNHKSAKPFMTYAVGKLEAALNISHLILSTSSQRVS